MTFAGFRVLLPVRTSNRSNASFGASRAAVFAEAAERKRQRSIAALGVGAALRSRGLTGADVLPCTVLVTRIAFGRGLDPHDGLPISQKSIVDGIADGLGLRSDRDERITWAYAQRRGKPKEFGVLVEVRLQRPFTDQEPRR